MGSAGNEGAGVGEAAATCAPVGEIRPTIGLATTRATLTNAVRVRFIISSHFFRCSVMEIFLSIILLDLLVCYG